MACGVSSSTPHRPLAVVMLSACYNDLPEQAVRFAIRSGGEEELVCLGGVPVAEAEAPEPIDDDRPAALLPQLAQVRAGGWTVDVDVSIPEVADEQIPAEPTETGRRQGQAPRRVERAAAGKPVDERAVIGEPAGAAAWTLDLSGRDDLP